MPEMNGVEAMIAIREEFPSARIIVLTTYVGDALVLRALEAGARAYLLKSVLRKELPETIRLVHAGQKRIVPAGGDGIGRACWRRCLVPYGKWMCSGSLRVGTPTK